MSTAVTYPTTGNYQANVISDAIEPNDLVTEISKQISSSECYKSTQQRIWVASPILSENESFLAFLNEILNFNVEDEEDQISADALRTAVFTTISAYAHAPSEWRRPRIATDGGGGARLTWRAGEKEIRAVFPADLRRPRYLYVEEGDAPLPLINNFTWITLWDKLAWLAGFR
jgi:hypothetical protein